MRLHESGHSCLRQYSCWDTLARPKGAKEVMTRLDEQIFTADHKRTDGGMFVIDQLTLG